MRALADRRGLELAVTSIVGVVAAPIVALLALLVRIRMGRPAFFHQERAGRDGTPFHLHKLRTMREGPGTDAERLTPLGSWLRRTSLDELPELWNVFSGEMALVGPRPLPVRYLDRYTPAQARRHEVRPGLTGWAQVNGRNATTWEERLERDVWYVDHRSLWLDLRILVRTGKQVLRRSGINADGEATMAEFDPGKHS